MVDRIRGFYYDSQLLNPLYTITLHPNTRAIPKSDGVLDWVPPGPASVDTGDDLVSRSLRKTVSGYQHHDTKWDAHFTNGYSGESGGTGDDGWLPPIDNGPNSKYYAEPVMSCIFGEDFNFSVTNEWGGFDGGNAIEDIFKSVKPFAPIVSRLGEGLKGASKSMEGYNGFGSGIVSTLTGFADRLGGAAKEIGGTLNKALYVQGTRYQLYNGTSTGFGNLSMKCTLLSDWQETWPGSGVTRFLTVYDQLNALYPYCVGFYEREQGGLGWLSQKLPEKVRKPIDDFVKDYVGWQSPPAGFEANTKNVDVCNKGTLRMMFGGYYTIDNLVVRGWNVNLSRQMCKHPVTGRGVPLYADVMLELQPASVYTDIRLARFLGNSGMEEIQEAHHRKADKKK